MNGRLVGARTIEFFFSFFFLSFLLKYSVSVVIVFNKPSYVFLDLVRKIKPLHRVIITRVKG